MRKFKMSLLEKRPDVLEIWDMEKNSGITPDKIAAHSRNKYWFKCKKGHEWETPAYNIADGTGCRTCANKDVTEENCLATIKPAIAKQLHPTKNNGKTTHTIAAHSNKKVWWICPRGHEYESSPNSRKSPYTGCKRCKSELQTSFPEQAIFYYIKQVFPSAENRSVVQINNKYFELDIYISDLALAIEYDGFFHKDHVKRDEQKNKAMEEGNIQLIRIREEDLPDIQLYGSVYFQQKSDSYEELNKTIEAVINYISIHYNLTENQKHQISKIKVDTKIDEITIFDNFVEFEKNNSLAAKFPELIKEWHPTLNKNLKPNFFMPFTNKRVWWKCSKGHEWQTAISNRTYLGNGCKYCSGQVVSNEKSLETRYPEVARQWDFKKNKPFTPSDKMPGSSEKVWWICKNGHSYPMVINKKVRAGDRCPICTGKRVAIENCLATVNPELAKEWNYEKNEGKTPYDYTSGSAQKVWWRCGKNPNHEWQARIKKRNAGHGCSICSGQKVIKENSLSTTLPELALQWHPIKNNPLTPEELTQNSNTVVWWKCSKGHEWQASPNSRVKKGEIISGCSICSNRQTDKSNNLLALYPEVAKDWDYSNNKEKRPEDFVPGSSIKVFWKCINGHKSNEQIRYRVRRGGCKDCQKI